MKRRYRVHKLEVAKGAIIEADSILRYPQVHVDAGGKIWLVWLVPENVDLPVRLPK